MGNLVVLQAASRVVVVEAQVLEQVGVQLTVGRALHQSLTMLLLLQTSLLQLRTYQVKHPVLNQASKGV